MMAFPSSSSTVLRRYVCFIVFELLQQCYVKVGTSILLDFPVVKSCSLAYTIICRIL